MKPHNMNNYTDWILPTLAGMGIAAIRRFRRQQNEKLRYVVARFIVHVATCLFAGYVVGMLLRQLGYENFVPPLCALSGLYGTMIIDWIEEAGIRHLNNYLASYYIDRGRRQRPYGRPYYDDKRDKPDTAHPYGKPDAAGESTPAENRAEDTEK